jgi:circadian clock protein KaiC
MVTSRGVRLREIYLGPGGVLTGSARVAREAEERRTNIRLQEEGQRRETAIKANLASVDAKIAALEAEKEFQEKELAAILNENAARQEGMVREREELRRSRGAIDQGSATDSRPNGRARRL